MEELLTLLKAKYNYDDKLLNLLKTIIFNMIIYFGEENANLIKSAFLETPIKVVKDRSDGENFFKFLGIKDKYSFPTFADGAYEEKIQINNAGKPERITCILMRTDDFNTDASLCGLVHELCHMVMNYGKIIIKDNKIISKTGLIQEEYEIKDGEINLTTRKDVAFEEGINEYDARKITELILGRKPEDKNLAYALQFSYVSPLMNDEDSRKIVNQSRLNGDNDWMNILGFELSQKYKDAINEYVSISFNISINDEEKEILKLNSYTNLKNIHNIVIEHIKSIESLRESETL